VAAIGRARVNRGGSAYPPALPRRVPGRNLPDWLAVPTSGPAPMVDIATIEAVYWWMVHSWDVSNTARHADTEDLRASDLTGQAVRRGLRGSDPDGTQAWQQMRPRSLGGTEAQ
jgi:hypothetical protein